MNEQILRYYADIKSRVNKLTLRERILMLVTGGLLIYILMDYALLSSIFEKNQQIQDDAIYQQKGLEGSLQELKILQNGINNLMNENEQGQYFKLQEMLKDQKKILEKSSSSVVSLKKIPDLIEQMLKDTSGLILIDVETQAEDRLDDQSEGKELRLNRYKIRLMFTGEYNQFIQYMKKIELLPYPIRWDEYEYKVTKYPQAQIMVNLYVALIEQPSKHYQGSK